MSKTIKLQVRVLVQRALIGSLRYVCSLRRRESFHPSAIKTILVVELTHLGDVIAMLPFLERLQISFPNASIRVLMNQHYISLFNALDMKFEFVGADYPETTTGLAKAVQLVRSMPVDLAISMSPPRRNALVTLASDSRFKVGYLSYLDSLTPFLTSTPVEAFGFVPSIMAAYARANIYERPDRILATLGIEPKPCNLHAELKRDVHLSVRSRLLERGSMPESRFVLLHPFSGWEYRNWGLEKFVELANRIVEELEYDVVISCEAGDSEKVTSAVQRMSRIRIDGHADLLEVAVLMMGASLVVGNDSGPLHLAAALNVRSIGLFGPAGPELTAPKFDRGRYLYKSVECSPCDQRICIRPDNPCMRLHKTNEVFSAVAGALEAAVLDESVTTNA
jgi:3-deoxy-D-manno-octulosonic-acid transferase/heptosyltransferase-1